LKVHRDSGAVYDALANYFTRDDAEKLLAVANEWAGVDPTNPKPFMLAAQVHVNRASELRKQPHEALEQLRLARDLLDSALTQRPDDPMARAQRLRVLLQIGALTTDPAVRAEIEREINAARSADAARFGNSGSMLSPVPTALDPKARVYPNAVRVGGNVPTPKKIRDVKPTMPPLAVSAGVQGVVIMETVIDESGAVVDARVLRSIPLLDAAALDAVKQWLFTPTLVDGKAVPVIMTVTVQFTITPR
jgi:protein TonB